MTTLDTKSGQNFYSNLTLKIYNILVLTISNRFAWKCTTVKQLKYFNQNITNNHLDVGVGSGYYMDNCQFPDVNSLKLSLMDMNEDCLNYCQNKLQRYNPSLLQYDIFKPLTEVEDRFDSISLNYVLHCLPGNMDDKEVVINNLKYLLNPNGVFFGSTILGHGVETNWLANKLMTVYNKKGIFSNHDDDKSSLYQILSKHYRDVEIKQIGMVAVFKATNPIHD